MEAVACQIRDLYAQADEEERRKLQNDLRDLQTSLDTDWDMLVRIGSGVSIFMALCILGVI
jgi:demethylsterigmatocystin 6-O-methyltransferase